MPEEALCSEELPGADLQAYAQSIHTDTQRRQGACGGGVSAGAALGRGGLPMESTLGSNSDRHGQGLDQLGGAKPLGPSAAVLSGGAAVDEAPPPNGGMAK